MRGQEELKSWLQLLPGLARRAVSVSLNKTGKAIKEAEQKEMRRVFDNPVPYTLNSLQLDPSTPETLQAAVWFKEPARMGQHYLVPQVEGGSRRLKGFELALGGQQYVPGKAARLTKYGNVSYGQIKQVLSTLGRAERYTGATANISSRSRRRNTRPRDYVVIRRGNKAGLVPGVYERYHKPGARKLGRLGRYTDRSRVLQQGRTHGRFTSVVTARGLRPVLLLGRTGKQVRARLDFYEVAEATYDRVFLRTFYDTVNDWLR